jgi:hypothetical protein
LGQNTSSRRLEHVCETTVKSCLHAEWAVLFWSSITDAIEPALSYIVGWMSTHIAIQFVKTFLGSWQVTFLRATLCSTGLQISPRSHSTLA